MKDRRIVLLLAFLCFLALVSGAWAISSPNYAIDWNVMGGGGGPISGTAYRVNGTAGQAIIGPVSGTSYQMRLGYWVGAAAGGPADVMVSKGDEPDPVAAGGALTYTLTFTNTGPAAAQDVYLTETLPVGVSYGGEVSVPAGMTQVSVNPPAWFTLTLGAGESGAVVFTVTVGGGVSGVLINTVSITTTTPDSNPNNNADEEPTAIQAVQQIYLPVILKNYTTP